jgi:hypothetical protein
MQFNLVLGQTASLSAPANDGPVPVLCLLHNWREDLPATLAQCLEYLLDHPERPLAVSAWRLGKNPMRRELWSPSIERNLLLIRELLLHNEPVRHLPSCLRIDPRPVVFPAENILQ